MWLKYLHYNTIMLHRFETDLKLLDDKFIKNERIT